MLLILGYRNLENVSLLLVPVTTKIYFCLFQPISNLTKFLLSLEDIKRGYH